MTDDTDTKTITIEFSVPCSEPLPEKMTLSPRYSRAVIGILTAQQTDYALQDSERILSTAFPILPTESEDSLLEL